MADPMEPKKENDEDKANKVQISIYVDPEMLKIVDAQVKRQRWGSRSHAFGYAMYEALLELGFIKENGVSEPKDQSGPSE